MNVSSLHLVDWLIGCSVAWLVGVIRSVVYCIGIGIGIGSGVGTGMCTTSQVKSSQFTQPDRPPTFDCRPSFVAPSPLSFALPTASATFESRLLQFAVSDPAARSSAQSPRVATEVQTPACVVGGLALHQQQQSGVEWSGNWDSNLN